MRSAADTQACSSRDGAGSGPEEEDVHDIDFRASDTVDGAVSPAGSEASGARLQTTVRLTVTARDDFVISNASRQPSAQFTSKFNFH